jgi:hypothetical protein
VPQGRGHSHDTVLVAAAEAMIGAVRHRARLPLDVLTGSPGGVLPKLSRCATRRLTSSPPVEMPTRAAHIAANPCSAEGKDHERDGGTA